MAFCVGQCGETTIIALKILGCELYNTFLFSQTCGSDFPRFFFFTIYIFDILDSSFLNFWLSPQKTKRLLDFPKTWTAANAALCRACEEPTTPKLTVAAVVSWATQVTIWVSLRSCWVVLRNACGPIPNQLRRSWEKKSSNKSRYRMEIGWDHHCGRS